ncbi:MAG TPA: YdeI/OmpD-associated family protein [Dehalococcoidia bacterium]|nr:YdeI/OmpD-associated family protein [Dehalococcoidia bacterium]
MTSERRLTRAINPVPPDVRKALVDRGLVEAYEKRPPYQRNDYIGWITGAKLDWTRQKRLNQMLDELEQGGVYMRMAWRPL